MTLLSKLEISVVEKQYANLNAVVKGVLCQT